MGSTTTSPLTRTAGAVALVGAALLPGLIAALPLAFNGAQHTLSALGRATMPEGATASLGWGVALLTAAVLPFVAVPASLFIARAGLAVGAGGREAVFPVPGPFFMFPQPDRWGSTPRARRPFRTPENRGSDEERDPSS